MSLPKEVDLTLDSEGRHNWAERVGIIPSDQQIIERALAEGSIGIVDQCCPRRQRALKKLWGRGRGARKSKKR
jgi:hypothetical protein